MAAIASLNATFLVTKKTVRGAAPAKTVCFFNAEKMGKVCPPGNIGRISNMTLPWSIRAVQVGSRSRSRSRLLYWTERVYCDILSHSSKYIKRYTHSDRWLFREDVKGTIRAPMPASPRHPARKIKDVILAGCEP
eukprot:3299800-Pyramimonas_sp.AAC.1